MRVERPKIRVMRWAAKKDSKKEAEKVDAPSKWITISTLTENVRLETDHESKATCSQNPIREMIFIAKDVKPEKVRHRNSKS